MGVFEIAEVHAHLRHANSLQEPPEELVQLTRRGGMRTLPEAAVLKVARGRRSFEEVVRLAMRE